MVILFTVEFNVQNSTRGDYRAFIQNLRVRLGLRFSHNRPALVVQENPPTHFFNVVLRTRDHSVTFRFRADNLYLIGYQMETRAWLEFDERGPDGNLLPHLITESNTSWLGFNGSYRGLAAAGDRTIDRIRVGVHNLVSAVNDLAVTTSGETRARGLVVVIMMICESARLLPISEYMAANFNNNPGTSSSDEGQIPSWVRDLANSWDPLSTAVLRADAFPEQSFQLRPNTIRLPPDNREVRTIQQALEILGILLGLCFSQKGPRRRVRAADEGMCYLGSPILQVFSLRIDNIDGEKTGELYGTVTVNNGLYTQAIYNRTRGNYESISPGQNATLTGPDNPISAFGEVTIKLALTDKDVISWDDLLVDDNISWRPYNISNSYDKFLSRQLTGSNGTVTLNYAVLRNAVAAEILITLEDGGESTCEVYGDASVDYKASLDSSSTNDDATCVLFKRSSSDYVSVNRWERIPLLRSVLAVPLGESLTLSATFYDYDPITPDDLIAKGTIQLSAPDQIPGNTLQSMTGDGRNFVTISTRWTFAV